MVVGSRRQVVVLVDAEAAHPSARRGSSTRGMRWTTTADMTVSQPTPHSRATEAIDRPSWTIWRVTSWPARCVKSWRGTTPVIFSVQVFRMQPFVRQRHRRFFTMSRSVVLDVSATGAYTTERVRDGFAMRLWSSKADMTGGFSPARATRFEREPPSRDVRQTGRRPM